MKGHTTAGVILCAAFCHLKGERRMEEKLIREKMKKAVEDVRKTNPLAGSITNYITVDLVANAQLAVGGSAAMCYLTEEGEFFVEAGGAVYLNMGGLLPILGESIPATAKKAHELGKPWVLDPVAIGIGSLRMQILKELKPYKPSIIRGNASEIIALASYWDVYGEAGINNARGVDSTESVDAASQAAVALARYTGGAVAVSGKVDLVTDGNVVARLEGGSHFMEKVTGCGCSLGGVVAVYACVADPFIAAMTACSIYNLAGARAEAKCAGPGSFIKTFLDELYLASPEEVARNTFTMVE